MDQMNLSKKLFIFFLFYNNIKLAIGDKRSGETQLQNVENELLDSLPSNVFDGIFLEKWLNKFTAGILCSKKFEKSETNTKNDETETIKFGQKLLDDFCQNFKKRHGIVQAAKMAEKQAIGLMKKMEADRNVQKLIENAKNVTKLKEISSNFKKLTKDQLKNIVYLKFGEMAKQMKGHGIPYNKQRSKRAVDSSPADQLMLDFDLVTTCILLVAYTMVMFYLIHFRRTDQLFFHIIFLVFYDNFIANCLLFEAKPWQRFPKVGLLDDDGIF